jgi:iron complex transport system substrate-binding protein
MPCGFGLDDAVDQAATFADRGELRSVRALYVVDANACFSRPGPRLVDGVEALAAAVHPSRVPHQRPDVVRRIR